MLSLPPDLKDTDMTTAQRQRLRQLIVDKLLSPTFRCPHVYSAGTVGTIDACETCVADAVADLFDHLEAEALI
jgi:hypothetical protein